MAREPVFPSLLYLARGIFAAAVPEDSDGDETRSEWTGVVYLLRRCRVSAFLRRPDSRPVLFSLLPVSLAIFLAWFAFYRFSFLEKFVSAARLRKRAPTSLPPAPYQTLAFRGVLRVAPSHSSACDFCPCIFFLSSLFILARRSSRRSGGVPELSPN